MIKTKRPGAAKSGKYKKKRKSAVKGAAPKMKISGIGEFKRSSCHTSKANAQSEAERKRKQGMYARVVKSGNALCVYTRNKTAPSKELTY